MKRWPLCGVLDHLQRLCLADGGGAGVAAFSQVLRSLNGVTGHVDKIVLETSSALLAHRFHSGYPTVSIPVASLRPFHSTFCSCSFFSNTLSSLQGHPAPADRKELVKTYV